MRGTKPPAPRRRARRGAPRGSRLAGGRRGSARGTARPLYPGGAPGGAHPLPAAGRIAAPWPRPARSAGGGAPLSARRAVRCPPPRDAPERLLMARLFGDAREELVFGILTRALNEKRFSRTLTPIPLQAWMDAVGPSLSARTRPTALSRGILHVAVADHRWRDQIDAARALILRRLNAGLGPGTVRGFQFGPLPPLAAPAAEAPLGDGEECSAALALDVSEAFARAARAAHRRQRA